MIDFLQQAIQHDRKNPPIIEASIANLIVLTMQIQQEDGMQPTQTVPSPDPSLSAVASLPAGFAYSMDALIPGLYFWCGLIKLRIGGSPAEPTYPGTLHSRIGIALVLPGYRIYST